MARRRRFRDAEDIKAEIRRRGLTMTSIALDASLSESAVRIAMRWQWSYPAEQAVAKAIGVPARELWPERYEPDGTPRHPRIHAQNTQRALASHRQKGAAA